MYIYSYREVNNNIQYVKFCTCVKKITITLTRRWDFHINNLYKFTKFSNTMTLHEENNSLNLNVLT